MTTSELAWDYTGDESSPLLSSAADDLRSSERKCILTQRQVLHLIHNLREVSQILNYESRRNSTAFTRHAQHTENNEHTDRSILSFIYKQCSRINITYLYLIVISLLFGSLAVDSFIDIVNYPHVPYASIAASCFASVGLAIIYLIFLLRIKNQRQLPLMINLISSYVVTAFLFASLFTAFSCSQIAVEGYVPSLHILKYLNNLQASLCLMTLSYYGQIQPSCWNSLLLITIQSVLSYWHLILILSRLLPFMFYQAESGQFDHAIQFVEESTVGIQAPFDDAGSYTFNQNRNMYGSVEVLERNLNRCDAHSCPASIHEEPTE